MEHNSLIGFNNGLIITYSDLKTTPKGSKYIVLYFEQPSSKKSEFKKAQIKYPGGNFTNVVGFQENDLNKLWEHVARIGGLALSFAEEDIRDCSSPVILSEEEYKIKEERKTYKCVKWRKD